MAATMGYLFGQRNIRHFFRQSYPLKRGTGKPKEWPNFTARVKAAVFKKTIFMLNTASE
jgi:hypothetical protein